jgi:hypothetical protein
MYGHVELDRRFVDFDPQARGELDDLSLSILRSFLASKTWNDIPSNRCTVIIAEAGAGKTAELRHQATTLRAKGEHAFFCPLELLAMRAFDKSLEIGTAAELRDWQHGDRRGYFFLDSVDEARLASAKDFEHAVLNLVEAIEQHKDRSTIVLSTRPHAWHAYADRDLLARRLGLAPASTLPALPSEHDTDSAADVLGDDAELETTGGDGETQPAIQIVQMAPLSEQQVRLFAAARGITDVDAFMDAIERADADVFATRPADLPGLINLWSKEGRIGRYSEVVPRNIELKLEEANPAHERDTIAKDRAMAGATMLAAAVTSTKRTPILLPDQPIDQSLEDASIDPKQVLGSWTPSEVQALLGRALFDESLYGTVRFHHRTAREYLTARWLQDLLQQHKNRRKIQSLLFARPYGVLSEVVVPSMKPIVGWLAAWDEGIRNKAMHVDPKVLLEFGDPSALDIGTRSALLKHFAGRYPNRKRTPLSLHVREVRRLADPRLSDVVRELLTTYLDHDDVRELMLRIACEGRVPNCGDLALELALADGVGADTRALAVGAVATAGTPEQRTRIAEAIVAEPASFEREVLAAAIEMLWPDCLSLSDLVRLLEGAEPLGAFSWDRLQEELGHLVCRLPTSEQRLELLRQVVALIGRPPLHDDNDCRISTRYDWLLPLAFELLKSIILSSAFSRGYKDVPRELLTPLLMCKQASNVPGRGDIAEEAGHLIQSNPTVKHALFWHEIEEARRSSNEPITTWWTAISNPPSNFEDADGDRFFDAIQHGPSLDDKLVALSVLTMFHARSREQQALLCRLHEAVRGNPPLEQALQDYLTPRPLSEQQVEAEKKLKAIEAQGAARRLAVAKERQTWIDSLKADPSRVGDLTIAPQGGVWGNTVRLASEIQERAKQGGRFACSRWELLETEFGSAVALAYRDFCQGFWRLYKPQLRTEGAGDSKNTPWAVIIGLSGIAMETRSVDRWAAGLTGDDAIVAARYALWELNELPPWFASLHQSHAKAVTDILLTEIRWEFANPSLYESAGYVLSRLRWTAKELGRTLRPELIALVEAHPNGGVSALTEALTIVLRDDSPVPMSFVELAACRVEEAPDDQHKALWLSLLLCLDAQRAVPSLEEWVDAGRHAQEREQRITAILGHVWGDRFHSLASEHRNFAQPELLSRLLKLTYRHLRVEDDIHHDGTYSPGPRDEAQEARGHLLDLLCGIPGRATYDALIDLSRVHTLPFLKDRMLVLAEQRAEMDAEQPPWVASDIAIFAEDAERDPRTQKDLFELAVSRIDDLKLDLEEGDESEARLMRKVEDEIELRRAIANRLKQTARGKYTTGSEEELADRTRTDIRLHNPRVEARVPIEIKIAGK